MQSPPAGERCPLCTVHVAHTHHDDGGRRYYRCDHCTLIFLEREQRPTPAQELQRYQQHQNDTNDERYRGFLKRLASPLMDILPTGARGLDYGCGPAPALAHILSSAGFPTASYDPFFREDAAVLNTTYDFVTCSEVLEHVHEPRDLFTRFATTLLRNGGTLAIMTRFYGVEAPFATWWYRRDPTHVCFYCRDTMEWISRHHGWQLDCPAPNVAIFTVPH